MSYGQDSPENVRRHAPNVDSAPTGGRHERRYDTTRLRSRGGSLLRPRSSPRRDQRRGGWARLGSGRHVRSPGVPAGASRAVGRRCVARGAPGRPRRRGRPDRPGRLPPRRGRRQRGFRRRRRRAQRRGGLRDDVGAGAHAPGPRGAARREPANRGPPHRRVPPPHGDAGRGERAGRLRRRSTRRSEPGRVRRVESGARGVRPLGPRGGRAARRRRLAADPGRHDRYGRQPTRDAGRGPLDLDRAGRPGRGRLVPGDPPRRRARRRAPRERLTRGGGSGATGRQARYTILPATTVVRTARPSSRPATGSSLQATRSASAPRRRTPERPARPIAVAAPVVYAATAVAASIASPGATVRPSSPVRSIAARRLATGSGGATGVSLPNASTAPEAASERIG